MKFLFFVLIFNNALFYEEDLLDSSDFLVAFHKFVLHFPTKIILPIQSTNFEVLKHSAILYFPLTLTF